MSAEEKGKSIFFIYSGTVNIMDKRILLLYGKLNEGSYFGDISTFLNEPSQYSYVFDQYSDRPL